MHKHTVDQSRTGPRQGRPATLSSLENARTAAVRRVFWMKLGYVVTAQVRIIGVPLLALTGLRVGNQSASGGPKSRGGRTPSSRCSWGDGPVLDLPQRLDGWEWTETQFGPLGGDFCVGAAFRTSPDDKQPRVGQQVERLPERGKILALLNENGWVCGFRSDCAEGFSLPLQVGPPTLATPTTDSPPACCRQQIWPTSREDRRPVTRNEFVYLIEVGIPKLPVQRESLFGAVAFLVRHWDATSESCHVRAGPCV
jgi:hypothetical protein